MMGHMTDMWSGQEGQLSELESDDKTGASWVSLKTNKIISSFLVKVLFTSLLRFRKCCKSIKSFLK